MEQIKYHQVEGIISDKIIYYKGKWHAIAEDIKTYPELITLLD